MAVVDAVLGRPTGHSMAVSLLADRESSVRVVYSPADGGPVEQTAPVSLQPGQPVTVDLVDLAPDTRYTYHLEHLDAGATQYQATTNWTFHTRRPAGVPFTFVVQADLHFGDDSVCNPDVYEATVGNMLADEPDFLVDLGDTFMTEKYPPSPLTYDTLEEVAADLRREYLGKVGASVPLFLVSGNHDSELGWLIPPDSATDNRAVWSTRIREDFFPSPVFGPDFRGSTQTDPALLQPRDGFYAFQWGSALIIVLDPFWYTNRKPASGTPDPWGWTLGELQYNWLKDLLASSRDPFKFVFIHHLVGGTADGKARGGLEVSDYFEWGGYNTDGSYGFDERRPGWGKPVQDLLLESGVQVVFHGHDHLLVKQDLDADGDGHTDLVYFECPQPASRIFNGDKNAVEYGYLTSSYDAAGRPGVQGGSGHMRVVVDASRAVIEYVRAYAERDRTAQRVNGDVTYSFVVDSVVPPIDETPFPGTVILGRPANTSIAANLWSTTHSGDVFLTWRGADGRDSGQSATYQLQAGNPLEVELTNLSPNARYTYRVWLRPAGAAAFLPAPERAFHTARAPGSTFTFTVQGDSHPERRQQFDGQLYERTLRTAAADQPDFHILMGDDFSVDTLDAATVTREQVVGRYTLQRPYLGLIGDGAPLFLVNGNHEQAARYLLDGTPDNVAVWAQNARNAYYPQPAPDGFYTGNAEMVPHIGLLRNHFAWTWGDALFVVIDPYWSSPTCIDNPFGGGDKRSSLWDVEHGDAQYNWLKQTLEGSTARHKFVFAHHVLGTGRGGVELANTYEWGGYDRNGQWLFEAYRPDWPKPIHQLMADNGVTIFFQGHDHIWVKQELDGVIYQTLSEPADPYYTLYNDSAYLNGVKYPNTGYTRVKVGPNGVKVEYVRTWLPKDEGPGQASGSVAYSYHAGATPTPWGEVAGDWRWSPLGWVHDSAWPYVYLASANCYGWMPTGMTLESLFCYLFQEGGFWVYTGAAWNGWYYHFGGSHPGWNRWQPYPN